jgi:hypothetical protein
MRPLYRTMNFLYFFSVLPSSKSTLSYILQNLRNISMSLEFRLFALK